MNRRFTTLWLITLALLGNLLSPALALRCAAPEPGSHVCPMSGKTEMHCCCAAESSPSTKSAAPQLLPTSDPCACQMTPGTNRDTGNLAISLAPELVAQIASPESFAVVPPTSVFTTAPLASVSQTPQTLPRAPDSGRAPPVS